MLLFAVTWVCQATAGTTIVRVPNDGIQPQAALGEDGTIHLIYFKGEPAHGDLFYVTRPPGEDVFSVPIRINSTDNAAIAMGTIRGAHLALGQRDRVHVAWMGSSKMAKTPTEEGGHPQSPMLYTRLNDSGDAFEPDRDVMQWTGGLDGGGSVAADSKGNVFVAWHGSTPENTKWENGRAVFVAVSRDNGRTFARELLANPKPTGSCGCCGMRAFVDATDQLHLLYRAANPMSRDMTLLTSVDAGRTFHVKPVNQWMTQTCPMSSAFLADGKAGLLAATEMAGSIQLNVVSTQFGPTKNLSVITPANAKHPVMAVNERGEILVAWAGGAGWAKGGVLKWQLFDQLGKPKGDERTGADLPTWSFPAVVYVGGDFVLLH